MWLILLPLLYAGSPTYTGAPTLAVWQGAEAELLTRLAAAELDDDASTALVDLLLSQAPRAAWVETYDRLRGRVDPLRGEALEVLAIRALLTRPETRAEGAVRARALLNRRRTDGTARALVAEAALRDGDAGKAASLAGELPKSPEEAQIRDLAQIARGKSNARAGCEAGGYDPTCLEAVLVAGWPEVVVLASRSAVKQDNLPAADKARIAELGAYAAETSGQVRLAPELRVAAAAYDAGNTARRSAAVMALIEGWRVDEARKLAAGDPTLTKEVAALALSLDHRPESTTPEALAAYAEMIRLAPRSRVVNRSIAHHLILRGDPRGALTRLQPWIGEAHADLELARISAWAASVAEDQDTLITALLDGLAAAPDSESWRALADELARALGGSAEVVKGRGEFDEASRRYGLALALRPEDPFLIRGFAGSLWAAGELEAAVALAGRLVYLPGATSTPRPSADTADIELLARLLLASGRPGEARALLRAATSSPELDALAETLDVEVMIASLQKLYHSGAPGDMRDSAPRAAAADALVGMRRLAVSRPEDARVQHALADMLASEGLRDEAAARYQRARQLNPKDPWTPVAEAHNLTALGRPEDALERLDACPVIPDPRWRAALADARAGAGVVLAERAWRAGDRAAADAQFERLVAAGPSPRVYRALAQIYLSEGQPALALAWYSAARELSPSDVGLVRAETELLLHPELVDEARILAAVEHAAATGSPALSEEVEARVIVSQALLAERRGDRAQAVLIYANAWVTRPDDPTLRSGRAALLLEHQQPAEALVELRAALARDPRFPEALALVSRIAPADPAAAAALYDAAVLAGAADWVRVERDAAMLAVELERIVLLDGAKGSGENSKQAIDAAIDVGLDAARREYGGTARSWHQIGVVALQLGHFEQAISDLRASIDLEPGRVDAVLALAGAMDAAGQPGRARRELEAAWLTTGDPRLGLELVRRDASRSRKRAATEVLQEVDARAEDRGGLGLRAPPGQSPPRAKTPEELQLARSRAQAALETSSNGVWTLGTWTSVRTGTAGTSRLLASAVPLSAEYTLLPPVEAWVELVPTWLGNGGSTATSSGWGLQPTVGVGTAPGTRFGAELRLSPGLLAAAPPTLLWQAAVRYRFPSSTYFEAETLRAPVTDSYAAWVGATDVNGVDYGLARDIWGGLRGGYDRGWTAEAGVRIGTTSGLSFEDNPWQQAWLLSWVPLRPDAAVEVDVGVEATGMHHAGALDRFGAGGAGMFTPEWYGSGAGRLRVAWRPADGDVALCAAAAGGAQALDGGANLFLQDGLSPQLRAELAALGQISPRWSVGAGGAWLTDLIGWNSFTAQAQLMFGPPSGARSTPGPLFSSTVHGLYGAGPALCGGRGLNELATPSP